ncbi:hypothetical protein BV25DRAFT_1823917 [Artomyces pyxidatus]|uniref:Uncharacterized protein n=1 Tax=Artomyces pyxidatus TaxID=48021 RepID=A0ACB8T772_9AGAM|nr:hypothetical protein BV25DRAFT_1823917 [Artomyces pyxidatus]
MAAAAAGGVLSQGCAPTYRPLSHRKSCGAEMLVATSTTVSQNCPNGSPRLIRRETRVSEDHAHVRLDRQLVCQAPGITTMGA